MVLTLRGHSNCILLYNQSAAWLKDATWGSTSNIVANASVISGWWPSRLGDDVHHSSPGWHHFAITTDDLMLPWTGCQARRSSWAIKGYFSFSPYIGTTFNSSFVGYNFTFRDPSKADANPFDQWLLCGINGSCTDLSPMAMLRGGYAEKGQLGFDWKDRIATGLRTGKNSGSFKWKTSSVKYTTYERAKHSASPVCVCPPIIWIVSNISMTQGQESLDCSPSNCFYALC